MISKRREVLSDVGRMPWAGEHGARGQEAQPGVGRQQPSLGTMRRLQQRAGHATTHMCVERRYSSSCSSEDEAYRFSGQNLGCKGWRQGN